MCIKKGSHYCIITIEHMMILTGESRKGDGPTKKDMQTLPACGELHVT